MIHRDVKPSNFAVGLGKSADTIYIFDYGLSKFYYDYYKGRHIPFTDGKGLVGTARYASINAHLGYEQSRRDDLESLGYSLTYLLRGSLPWEGIRGPTKEAVKKKICEKKMAILIEELCEGMPKPFSNLMRHARSLAFDERPNYIKLKKLFREYFIEKKLNINFTLDWNKTLRKSESEEYDEEETPRMGLIQKNDIMLKTSTPTFIHCDIEELKNCSLAPTRKQKYYSFNNGTNFAEKDVKDSSGTFTFNGHEMDASTLLT